MPEATVFPGAAPPQPGSPTCPAPAPVVTFTVLPDLAVKAVLPRGADLNETAAAQLYRRLGELAGDRRVAVVLELTGVLSVNRAARAAYAAIPSVPARYFTSEKDALDWLSHLDDVF